MKILCLRGDFGIENISSVCSMLKSSEYDNVDYSEATLDVYVKVLLDSYNEHINIPQVSVTHSSFGLRSELLFLCSACDFSRIILKRCKYEFQTKYFYSNVIADLYNMGRETFFVVALTSLLVGVDLGYQTWQQLREVGMADNVMSIVVVAAFKQAGILIAFFVLVIKYASGLISKIGFMKVSEEWIALKIMKVDPEIFLIKTKIYALMLLLPFFAYLSILFFILGGFLVIKLVHGTTLKFFLSTAIVTDPFILIAPLLKGMLMGGAIGVLAGYEASSIESSSDKILESLNHGLILTFVVGFLIHVFLDLFFCHF